MQSMNYIGRFISNFKDFYNDINGATLTGAIDVIVVEQPDGTYTCSPFHVRFGKLGVLRSREKIVDIEINGVPRGIHMKLGESGEAFFVEEVQDSDEDDIPDHLATSPIPDSNLEDMYNGQGYTRRNSFDSIDKPVAIFENQLNDYSQRRNTDPTDDNSNFSAKKREFISRQIELGNLEVTEHSNDEMTLSIHSNLSKDIDMSTEPIFKMDSLEMEPASTSLVTDVSPIKEDQTDSRPKPEKEEHEKLETETKSAKKRRRKKSVMKKKNTQRKTPAAQTTMTVSESSNGEAAPLTPSEESSDTNVKMSDSATGSLASNSSEADLCDNLECSSSSRKVQRDPDFHFFSDTELTTGPNDSRPHTPVHMESVQSDTEFEVKNRKVDGDDGSQTNSWAWGQFPVTQIPTDVSKSHEQTTEAQAQRNSMLTTVFSFMKQNKNNRMLHSPSQADGVYLADLSTIEPEVAALYLTNSQQKHGNDADMDCESGNGPSLPQSPNSVEGAKSIDSDYDENTKANCPQLHDHDISLSLCGWEKELNEDTFVRNVVNFSDLCNNPSLLESQNLVVRIRDKYFTWKAASPIIASLMIYQRALPQSTVDQLCNLHMINQSNVSDKANSNSGDSKQEQQAVGGRYSWWGWRRNKGASRETTPTLETANTSVDQHQQQLEQSVSDNTNTNLINTEGNQNVQEAAIVATKVEPPVQSDTRHEDSLQAGYQSSADSEKEKSSSAAGEIGVKSTSEKCRKTLRLSSEQIAKLNLNEDMNEVEFSVTTAYQGTSRCKCHIYKWRYDDKIVISDIDGTITKSDVLGHILPIVGNDWAQSGVAQLFTKIKDNGYKLLYLSARAIGQARITREYLRSIRQGDLSMPDGPMLLNPTSLISAFHREVIERKPEQFKISCMSDIQALFPVESSPLYAGYGNKINDVWAYRAVGIPIVRIFTINPKGELKHELTQTFQSSYSNMSYIVDHLFPPLIEQASDFNQFVYWREPIQPVEDLILPV